jgi:hypothetical protein
MWSADTLQENVKEPDRTQGMCWTAWKEYRKYRQLQHAHGTEQHVFCHCDSMHTVY